MTERKPVDWERIEAEYRAGQLSVREIARQHGVTHTAINKRAKAEGWEQDLAGKVRQQASAKLVSDAVSSEVSKANAKQIVEAAAARVVEIVRQHRGDIRDDIARVARLSGKLETLIDGVSDLKSLETAQGIMESIARTRSKLIPLERQAFGLANNAAPDDDGDKKGGNSIKLEFVTAQVPPGG